MTRPRRPRQPPSSSFPLLPASSEFYVPHLPLQPISSRRSIIQYAGHLPSHPNIATTPSDAHLFFWLVRAKHIASRESLVIFFNGGPGCSSMEGGLIEVGPFRVKEDESGQLYMEEATHAWTEYANVLFLDQPAGTGFSYVTVGDDVRELDQAAEQVVTFLSNFYSVFPEFSNMDTYLAGESYAGQYIPYVATALQRSANLPTRLKGMLMGNPWIDPSIQYPAYMKMAYSLGWFGKGTFQAKVPERHWALCEKQLKSLAESGSARVLTSACEAMLDPILKAGSKVVDGFRKQPVCYNITEYAEPGEEWPKQNIPLTKYLDRTEVITAFNAGSKRDQWVQCNNTVGSEMWSPHSVPSSQLLPSLLPAIPTLIYVGANDFICNTIGVNATIEALEWNGLVGWNGTLPQEWWVDGRQVGSWQSRDNVSFVVYDNASHMVPIDDPVATHDMFLRFLDISAHISAGPSATIPSQVGDKASEILSPLHPNGTVLESALNSTLDALSSAGVEEKIKSHEAYYGPRRTATLVLVLSMLVAGVAILFKARRRSRQKVIYSGRRRQKKRKKDRSQRSRGMYSGLSQEEREDKTTSHHLAERGFEHSAEFEYADEFDADEEADPDLAGDIALSPSVTIPR